MPNHYQTIIIGAGAAGLFCAGALGKLSKKKHLNHKMLVLDQANKVGKKILMSGGGRCNFTNLDIQFENYLSHNPHFCKSALSRYTQWDFISLVESYGIQYFEKTLGQLFCCDKSRQIVDLLLSECEKSGVKIKCKQTVNNIQKTNQYFSLQSNQESYTTDNLIIATGGLSIPTMGSSPFGYQIAEQFGLKVYPTRAGLVPFTWSEKDKLKYESLSGVSLSARVSCNGQSFEEQLLFTHRGLSGPAILQISSYWRKNQIIHICLAPEINLEHYLIQSQKNRPDKQLSTLLSQYFPKSLLNIFLDQTILNKPIKQLNILDIQNIIQNLQSWEFKPNGTEGYRTAEVTLGGVDCDAVSSKTFECKTVPNLYFIGEVLDVTGHLGGYNFQWAWSSAHACAEAIIKNKTKNNKNKKDTTLNLPGSKSITNRAILLAAFSEGEIILKNCLFSDDTWACINLIQKLGIQSQINLKKSEISIKGCSGTIPIQSADLYTQDAGTLTRFILPLLSTQPSGKYYLSASPRMQERPMGDLINLLKNKFNIKFEFKSKSKSNTNHYLPCTFYPNGLAISESKSKQNILEVDTQKSTQFLSGLLLAAPLSKNGLSFKIKHLESLPYVKMTLNLIKDFGAEFKINKDIIEFLPNNYKSPKKYTIEPDISTASYFYALAPLLGRSIIVSGVRKNTLQGDIQFLNCLEQMGCVVDWNNKEGIKVSFEHKKSKSILDIKLKSLNKINMKGFSDVFMTLSILAIFTDSPTEFYGLAHTRHQESDRIKSMEEGLNKLGIQTASSLDSLKIYPVKDISKLKSIKTEINSYSDHRIAMSFGLLTLIIPKLKINQSQCVSKTCPDFFERLKKIIK